MASLPQHHVGNFRDENRKYWRLREMLPTTYERERFSPLFMLHNVDWVYFATLNHDIDLDIYSLSLKVHSFNGVEDQFNVRVGIFGESGENVFLSDAKDDVLSEAGRTLEVVESVSSSQLESMIQSNELFIFFVEIKKKDEQKAKEKEEKERKAKVCKRKFETDYKELLLSGKKSDFTINVKHRKFNCHAIILSARSPVFSAMMEHEMKEKRSGEVFIPDADPDIFLDFLLYIYTGKEEHLDWENITDLYKLGDKYCMDDLICLCVEHMKTNMSIENFFEFFLTSQQHRDSELSEAAFEFFLENSEDIIESEKWTGFMKEYPDETYVLIKALSPLLKQVKHDIKNQRDVFRCFLNNKTH